MVDVRVEDASIQLIDSLHVFNASIEVRIVLCNTWMNLHEQFQVQITSGACRYIHRLSTLESHLHFPEHVSEVDEEIDL